MKHLQLTAVNGNKTHPAFCSYSSGMFLNTIPVYLFYHGMPKFAQPAGQPPYTKRVCMPDGPGVLLKKALGIGIMW